MVRTVASITRVSQCGSSTPRFFRGKNMVIFETGASEKRRDTGYLLLMVRENQVEGKVVEIPVFTRFYTSQVVDWDFFHRQYHMINQLTSCYERCAQVCFMIL